MTAPEVLDGWNSNWWALGLRALAAIVIVFGIYAITDGVLAIIAAIRGIRRKERWGAMLFEGIIGIVAGAIALVWPGIGALALTYLVAGWALATGAFEIAAAIRLRKIMTGEWLLMIAGILSIVFAVLIAAFPGVGALTLVWWLGAYALAYGVISLVLALRVRSWTTAHA